MNPRTALLALTLATASGCWRWQNVGWKWNPDQECWEMLKIPHVPNIAYHGDLSVVTQHLDENGDCWMINNATARPEGEGWGPPPNGLDTYYEDIEATCPDPYANIPDCPIDTGP